MKGYKPSEEHRRKISNSHKGKKKPWSGEIFRKIAKQRVGNKHHNWKGGISRGYKTGYYSSEYKSWRNSVFLRDCFTCQNCYRKNLKLNAHHIKTFSKYPELRFEISNGRTLCESCHRLVHKEMRKLLSRNK